MSELIDREATVKQICKLAETTELIDRNVALAIALFVQEDKSAFPTVERPHGEWEQWGSPFSDDTIANSIVCSFCKARYVEIEGEVFNFCPHCGASMRKEGEAE